MSAPSLAQATPSSGNARRLRVAHVKGDYRRIGGPEQLLRQFLPVMAQGECEPVLVALQQDRERRFVEELLEDAPVERHVLGWTGLKSAPLVAAQFARWLERSQIDLVHTHDMRANLVMALARLRSRQPWIAHVHGWLGATHSLRYRVYEAIDKRLIRRADRVLVGSHATMAEARHAGAARVSLVANAVAMPPLPDAAETASQRARLGLPSDVPLVAVFGRLHPGKGQDLLLEAARIVAGRAFHVIVVGEGESRRDLERRVAALDLGPRVTMTGFVEDTTPYFATADIVVVPSRKESLPLTALEAMAHSKPVVATAVGDLPLVIRDGVDGFVVPPDDAPAIASALMRLMDHPDLRVRLGRAGRARIREFYSVQAFVEKLVRLYGES